MEVRKVKKSIKEEPWWLRNCNRWKLEKSKSQSKKSLGG